MNGAKGYAFMGFSFPEIQPRKLKMPAQIKARLIARYIPKRPNQDPPKAIKFASPRPIALNPKIFSERSLKSLIIK